jgi:hypothetical protein
MSWLERGAREGCRAADRRNTWDRIARAHLGRVGGSRGWPRADEPAPRLQPIGIARGWPPGAHHDRLHVDYFARPVVVGAPAGFVLAVVTGAGSGRLLRGST